MGVRSHPDDPIVVVDVHHAEGAGIQARHFDTADRYVGTRLDVLLQHLLVIHLVDVIAREQHDELRRVARDDIDVLVNRIGGARVPLRFRDALTRRQNIETLVALGAKEVPAALQVPDQAMRFVLCGDGDPADARVQRIRKREVDDARFTAEKDGRLRAFVGEFHKSRAAPTGQDVRHGMTT